MNRHQEQLTHARRLRANLLAAPDVWIPRREILLEWLDGFLDRAARSSYDLDRTEPADLRALDDFLRKHKVPAA